MKTLEIHPGDNLLVALQTLPAGTAVAHRGHTVVLKGEVPQKHKFTICDLPEGSLATLYGVTVGRVARFIPAGGLITVENLVHEASAYAGKTGSYHWAKPDVSKWQGRTFMGYHRPDGRVGTRNYWLVVPLVFCENRNIGVIRAALEEVLGYAPTKANHVDATRLVAMYRSGAGVAEILKTDLTAPPPEQSVTRVFPNLDGIKFLTHEGGCGGTRDDSEALCRLLAGYIANSNVAGATVLSLGCQHAQVRLLKEALVNFDGATGKPVFFLEQQQSRSEQAFIGEAVKRTFTGCMIANEIQRSPAPIAKLCLGLECGGSDGFSGITANPALGHASDLLVALGGQAILSEFPELHGVEQELINRCEEEAMAQKFARLMRTYNRRAGEVGSGFSKNPSPGNLRDGLITDAIKSAGAAKKGGTAPVAEVLDYTEPVSRPGLSLLCTPGNDVESTTALAGSGANLIAFTTGLGTPTGNPVAPAIKLSTNTELARRMSGLIDLDAGTIISGGDTVESKGEELLELMLRVASGEMLTKAEVLSQDDFIPWKRGVSL
ncbi:MAG: altronate dehydratase [Saprospiraceae bacterium]|nr:MAG: altronate dehydratase [Saprospiraceae bacterium]